MTIATESGHFYLADGTPFYDAPNKSRPGEMRPATVRDALKVGAEPSVSTVLKCAAAPNLTRYFVESALDSAARLERLPNEPIEAFKARALLDSQERGKKARDRGTEIHGAIERYLTSQSYDAQYGPHIRSVVIALEAKGIDLHAGKPERSFCLPGQYGGKIDWSDDFALADFKGIDDDKLEGKLGYDEHIRQLAAYDNGLGTPGRRLLSVFIGRASGGVRVREWTPAEGSKALAEFYALLLFYRLSKGFPVSQWSLEAQSQSPQAAPATRSGGDSPQQSERITQATSGAA